MESIREQIKAACQENGTNFETACNIADGMGFGDENGDAIIELTAINDMLKALKGLVDDEPCRLDHDGDCQTHMVDNPCEQKLGRAAIAKSEGK